MALSTNNRISNLYSKPSALNSNDIHFQQIRSATVKIGYAGTTFLVDPMLSKQGTYAGFPNTYRSELRNPLVELPEPLEQVISGVDAVIVTHTHLDHWDDAAQEGLPKDIPLFTQHEEDVKIIQSQGFTDVRVIDDYAEFGGVKISKVGGQHGSDEMFSDPGVADFLGEAMGFVLEAPGVKTLYLAGDTVWRDEVDQAIEDFQPQVIVLNAGMALLSEPAGAMIMGKADVLRACRVAPDATVVAIHLDAINHMSLTREELRTFVQQEGIQDRVNIPEDGESVVL